MNRCAGLVLLSLACVAASTSMIFADAFDGMVLTADKGTGGVGVALTWTGGQPTFRVYRSTVAQTTLDPANQIGTTDVRSFNDTPPSGAIFYYEIKSPCVYNPPEICNGIDDDCDGTIDGPGSEASCQLPHATAQCVSGACAVGACDSGFGDCDTNPANGCESDLTSDSAHCGSCAINCDASLDNCHHSACLASACGAAFDTSRCLAPRGSTSAAGACAFAAANCSAGALDSDHDGLPDVWEDAGRIDNNCDGIYDSNDAYLPDSDKRVRDVYVHIAYMGPSTHLYPTQDTSAPGCPTVSFSEPPTGHMPQQDSIDLVVRAFAGAHLTPAANPCGKSTDPPCPSGFSCVDFACLPNCTSDSQCAQSCNADCQALGGARCVPQGTAGGNVCRLWRLHVDPLPAAGVPHHDIVSYGTVSSACANTSGGGSMTPGDQASLFDYKSAPSFDPKELAFKHFVLFGHDNTCYGSGSPGCGDSTCPAVGDGRPKPGTTGLSEIKGNDSIVSLGVPQFQYSADDRVVAEAGTLMHELGHNLGLDHGGPAGVTNPNVPKVNYLSVMGYLYQAVGIPYTDTPGSTALAGRRPDFSHQPLTTALDEGNLSEPAGIGAPGLQEPSTRYLIRYNHPNTPVCPCPVDPCTGLPYANCGGLAAGSGAAGGGVPPIDWNCDGIISPVGIAADINGNGIPGEIHDPAGTADWDNLFYGYQCQGSYVDGPTGPTAQGAPRPSAP